MSTLPAAVAFVYQQLQRLVVTNDVM